MTPEVLDYIGQLQEAGHRFTIDYYPIGSPHDNDIHWRIVVHKFTGAIGVGEGTALLFALREVWKIVKDKESETEAIKK